MEKSVVLSPKEGPLGKRQTKTH